MLSKKKTKEAKIISSDGLFLFLLRYVGPHCLWDKYRCSGTSINELKRAVQLLFLRRKIIPAEASSVVTSVWCGLFRSS